MWRGIAVIFLLPHQWGISSSGIARLASFFFFHMPIFTIAGFLIHEHLLAGNLTSNIKYSNYTEHDKLISSIRKDDPAISTPYTFQRRPFSTVWCLPDGRISARITKSWLLQFLQGCFDPHGLGRDRRAVSQTQPQSHHWTNQNGLIRWTTYTRSKCPKVTCRSTSFLLACAMGDVTVTRGKMLVRWSIYGYDDTPHNFMSWAMATHLPVTLWD